MSIVNNENVYFNTNLLEIKTPSKDVENGGVSAWQGIRFLAENQYIICGTTNPSPNEGRGLLYSGNISCTNGDIYYLDVPEKNSEKGNYTSVYGPDYDVNTGKFTFVGSYKSKDTKSKKIMGFCYNGTLSKSDLTSADNFSFPTAINARFNTTYLHSNMNGLIVGNSGITKLNPNKTISYILDQSTMKIKTKIMFPNSKTTTTYGIWYNGDNKYTIVGGYSNKIINIAKIYNKNLPIPYGSAFIVDYNSKTNTFSHWSSIDYSFRDGVVTHFEGISRLEDSNIFSLNADIVDGILNKTAGYYSTASINDKTGKYEINKWVELKYPGPGLGYTSSNSVSNDKIVGLYISQKGNVSYQATIT